MRDGPVSAPGSPRLLPVIANQCMGALQRVSLCGERGPKGALLPPGLQTAGSMADFGAKRCGNPRLRREAWQAGTTSGKFVYAFPYSPKVFPFTLCCCKENGLPRRFAPRHDMQKHAGWLHNTGRCRCTAGKRPCNRSSGANFRVPFAPNALAPAHTSFLLHVIANQCMGALQRVSLCGERSPKGALLPPGLQTAGSMADFGATRCGNPFSPQGNLARWRQFGRIRYALRIRPKYCCFLRPAAGLRIAASLLAMTCRNMPGGSINRGTAGILPENAPATAVPGQVFAHPSRQTPPRPLY